MNLKLGNKNSRRFLNLMAGGLFLTLAILLGFAIPSVAAEPPLFTVVFPAGEACDFALRLEGWGEGSQVYKEFVDKNGTVVRTLSAGTGYRLAFTNITTKATFSTKSNGAVSQTTKNPDGSVTQTLLGHNIVILFPTDNPPGPSTTLYVGRVIYNDTDVVDTLQLAKGKATDICAALSE